MGMGKLGKKVVPAGHYHESPLTDEMNLGNFIWIDVLDKSLSNDTNLNSINGCSVKLLTKYLPAFFFEMGSSGTLIIVLELRTIF
jgi:hypothetical protein